MSEFTDAGAVVGQGTLGGALVSQAVLDKGISEQFAPGGGDELTYGSVPIAPIIFQDDVIHGAEGVEEARTANKRMDIVVKKLNITLNKDKSLCTVIGSKNQRMQIRAELQKEPLMCGEIETELKHSFKWLGKIIASGGFPSLWLQLLKPGRGKLEELAWRLQRL